MKDKRVKTNDQKKKFRGQGMEHPRKNVPYEPNEQIKKFRGCFPPFKVLVDTKKIQKIP